MYWEEQFSIDRVETSTEQENNKYYISKTFLDQWLEDLCFAALNVQVLKTNLFLLICNDNVHLIVKDVFSEPWSRKFSDFILELVFCSSGSTQKTLSNITYLNSKLHLWYLKEDYEIGYCKTLSNFQCYTPFLRKMWAVLKFFSSFWSLLQYIASFLSVSYAESNTIIQNEKSHFASKQFHRYFLNISTARKFSIAILSKLKNWVPRSR